MNIINIALLLSTMMVLGLEAGIMEDLEPYFVGSSAGKLGISLKCDNGKYLSIIGRGGHYNAECAKSHKDPWTRFRLYKVGANTIAFKSCLGTFLKRVYYSSTKQLIQPYTHTINRYSIFKVYKQASGKISLRADNRLFLSRLHSSGVDYLSAFKGGVDSCSEFKFESGSLVPVHEEIIKLELHAPALTSNAKVAVIAQDKVDNWGSKDIIKTFSFTKTVQKTATTAWEHAWGITVGVEASGTIGLASVSTSVSVSYSGKYSSSNAKSVAVAVSKSTTVTCPPKKRCIAKLVIKELTNIPIPFTATIKRTDSIGTQTFVQKGTWTGEIFLDTYIEVREYSLK